MFSQNLRHSPLARILTYLARTLKVFIMAVAYFADAQHKQSFNPPPPQVKLIILLILVWEDDTYSCYKCQRNYREHESDFLQLICQTTKSCDLSQWCFPPITIVFFTIRHLWLCRDLVLTANHNWYHCNFPPLQDRKNTLL